MTLARAQVTAASASSQADNRSRDFGLDLVRCMAIGLVVIGHGSGFLPPVVNRVLVLYVGGFFGVELFFVLSGFLIGTILLREFTCDERSVNVGAFWIRRWFRTLPNYFLFLLLNATLFSAWFHHAAPFRAGYLLFLQNLAWPCPSLMPESWSLAIEEWFYLLLPLILLATTRFPVPRKTGLLLGIAFFVLAFTGLRFHQAFFTDAPWDSEIRKVVIYRLDAIGYGVCCAYAAFFHPAFMKRCAALLCAVGIALIALSVASLSQAILQREAGAFFRFGLFSTTSAGFALLLPVFKGLTTNNRFLGDGVRHISQVSYSMYLIHFSLAIPLVSRYLAPNVRWEVAWGSYLVVTVLLSSMVYRFFEKPMTDLRDRLRPATPEVAT